MTWRQFNFNSSHCFLFFQPRLIHNFSTVDCIVSKCFMRMESFKKYDLLLPYVSDSANTLLAPDRLRLLFWSHEKDCSVVNKIVDPSTLELFGKAIFVPFSIEASPVGRPTSGSQVVRLELLVLLRIIVDVCRSSLWKLTLLAAVPTTYHSVH